MLYIYSMAKKLINFRLDLKDIAILDALSIHLNISKTEVVRRLIRTKRKPVELRAAEEEGKEIGRTLYQIRSKK